VAGWNPPPSLTDTAPSTFASTAACALVARSPAITAAEMSARGILLISCSNWRIDTLFIKHSCENDEKNNSLIESHEQHFTEILVKY
jgi:hypothetical protein